MTLKVLRRLWSTSGLVWLDTRLQPTTDVVLYLLLNRTWNCVSFIRAHHNFSFDCNRGTVVSSIAAKSGRKHLKDSLMWWRFICHSPDGVQEHVCIAIQGSATSVWTPWSFLNIFGSYSYSGPIEGSTKNPRIKALYAILKRLFISWSLRWAREVNY